MACRELPWYLHCTGGDDLPCLRGGGLARPYVPVCILLTTRVHTVQGREVALQELRDEVPDELRAAKEAQEVQYLARTDHEGAWQDRHGAQLFVGVQQ